MKKILTLSLVLVFIGCSWLFDQPKYELGDCITPTDPISSLYQISSWHWEYARVDDFVPKSKDFSGGAYVLWFPNYKSNTVLFRKAFIESDTKKVNPTNCASVR